MFTKKDKDIKALKKEIETLTEELSETREETRIKDMQIKNRDILIKNQDEAFAMLKEEANTDYIKTVDMKEVLNKIEYEAFRNNFGNSDGKLNKIKELIRNYKTN